MSDPFIAAYKADMWRVDVAGVPIMVRGQVAVAHLEKVNRSLTQAKMALHQIAALARKSGGVGQIARDALRVL